MYSFTILDLTMSSISNSMNSNDLIVFMTLMKSLSPDFSCSRVKSDCLKSPENMILQLSPTRVIIESISWYVMFCTSSTMTMQFDRVIPRTYDVDMNSMKSFVLRTS